MALSAKYTVNKLEKTNKEYKCSGRTTESSDFSSRSKCLTIPSSYSSSTLTNGLKFLPSISNFISRPCSNLTGKVLKKTG